MRRLFFYWCLWHLISNKDVRLGQNISNEILSLKNLEVNCIFLNISSVNPLKKKKKAMKVDSQWCPENHSWKRKRLGSEKEDQPGKGRSRLTSWSWISWRFTSASMSPRHWARPEPRGQDWSLFSSTVWSAAVPLGRGTVCAPSQARMLRVVQPCQITGYAGGLVWNSSHFQDSLDGKAGVTHSPTRGQQWEGSTCVFEDR